MGYSKAVFDNSNFIIISSKIIFQKGDFNVTDYDTAW